MEITNDGILPEIIPYCAVPRKPRETYSNLGSKWKIGAKLSVDPITGEKIAEPGEKVDLDAYIQSSQASTDIATIYEKYKAGDETVINVNKNGFYGDVAILPKNVNDIVDNDGLAVKARESFDSLPADVKALFHNDPSDFFNAVITNNVDNILRNYSASKVKENQVEEVPPVEPVKENEGGNE